MTGDADFTMQIARVVAGVALVRICRRYRSIARCEQCLYRVFMDVHAVAIPGMRRAGVALPFAVIRPHERHGSTVGQQVAYRGG